MSENSNNEPSNAITMPILIAFMISTAIFSCLTTLLVTWIVLYRRRRHRRREILLRSKRKLQQKTTITPYPETPPMKSILNFPSGMPVSPPQYQHSFIATDRIPLSPHSPELIGPGETPRLVHEVDGSPEPIEMMGSTTWSKVRRSQSSLLRHPIHVQMIATAITEERRQTGQ